MQKRQGSTLESLRAIRNFIEANSAKFPDIAASGARKKLDSAIAELTVQVTDQSGSTMSAQTVTKRTRGLRSVLLHGHMEPIARIARAELPHTEELSPLRVPRGNPTKETLAAIARGMAQAAEPHSSVFVAQGLPADFIARLTAATDAMLASVDDRKQHQGRTSGATKGISEQFRVARQSVHILDSLVRNALVDEPVLLANWKRQKGVRRAARPSVAAGTPAVTPLPSGPTTTPGVAGTIAPAVVPKLAAA